MVSFDAALVLGFCLGLVRSAAWVAVSPPFSAMAIPVRVRAGLSLALALPLADKLADPALLQTDLFGLIGLLLLHALSGLALGFAVLVLFSALAAAGELIDALGGFSFGSTVDPLTGVGSTPFARIYQVFAVAFLFASGGHILLVRGFLRSVELGTVDFSSFGALARGLVALLGVMLLAAVEVGLPVLAALFLAEVALGLISKAAPQLNVYVTGFALKAMIAIMLASASLLLLGNATESLIGQALDGALKVFGA